VINVDLHRIIHSSRYLALIILNVNYWKLWIYFFLSRTGLQFILTLTTHKNNSLDYKKIVNNDQKWHEVKII
jgi:hypothetical protein